MDASYRAVYSLTPLPSPEPFALHVLGYRVERNHTIDVPDGTPSWFLHHFHDPVRLRSGASIVEAPAHTFAIDAPGEPIYHGRQGAWRHSWMRVSGTAAASLIADSGLRPATPYPVGEEEEGLRWLAAADALMRHARGPDGESVRRLVEMWLRRVRFLLGPSRENAIPQSVLLARRCIESHYLEPLALDTIARAASLSRSQLCRLFRKHLATSPAEYAIRCRLEHARDLLQTTSLTVGEVAARSGFRDVYYFSRLYKHRLGHPPSRERG